MICVKYARSVSPSLSLSYALILHCVYYILVFKMRVHSRDDICNLY